MKNYKKGDSVYVTNTIETVINQYDFLIPGELLLITDNYSSYYKVKYRNKEALVRKTILNDNSVLYGKKYTILASKLRAFRNAIFKSFKYFFQTKNI